MAAMTPQSSHRSELRWRRDVASRFPWELFGFTVSSVLEGSLNETRNLDCLELHCGVGSVWTSAQRAGKLARGYDKYRILGVTNRETGPFCEDILTESGFKNALSLVLSLRSGGLLWLAPVCSSFSWLALSVTLREASTNYAGDTARRCVAQGNFMARASAFLMTVAWARAVHIVLENKDLMFKYLKASGAVVFDPFMVVTTRCAFSDAPDGQRYLKRYKLLASESWISHVKKTCPCKKPKMHAPLAEVCLDRGRRRCTGIPSALKASGAYPARFGQVVIQAWLMGQQHDVSETPGAQIELRRGRPAKNKPSQCPLRKRIKVANAKVLESDNICASSSDSASNLCASSSDSDTLLSE